MANVILLKRLSKNFGNLQAVTNLDLTVNRGEIFGFLGPNGAGKSTTIRCMMGFMKPTSGNVTIFGHNMGHEAHLAKQRIGYLPGNIELYDNWTGWSHIHFFEGARGKSVSAESLIKRLNFDPCRTFRTLSSGNKQKLGLILALMNEPELLIMDEPTVGLDPLLQNEIYEILEEMRAKNTTVFISSHNLPEVERLCDRVALIREGELVTVATIADLSKKKTHIVQLQTDDPIDLAMLRKIKNVKQAESIAGGVSLKVDGDINSVVHHIAKYNLRDLSIEHASLEEIFMQYYRGKKGNS